MKKIITILSMFAGVSAFAITQANIDAANAICQNGGNIPVDENTVQVFEPIANLAISDIAEYLEVGKQAQNLGRWNYCVIKVAQIKGWQSSEDANTVLSGGGRLHYWANESIENYNALKARRFKSVGGYKMAEYRILMLTLRTYADPHAALEFVSEKELAKNFDVLLAAIRRARLSPKDAYELYTKINTDFAQYKNLPKVQANWEALQNDKNEAFMAAYADAKLKALER